MPSEYSSHSTIFFLRKLRTLHNDMALKVKQDVGCSCIYFDWLLKASILYMQSMLTSVLSYIKMHSRFFLYLICLTVVLVQFFTIFLVIISPCVNLPFSFLSCHRLVCCLFRCTAQINLHI